MKYASCPREIAFSQSGTTHLIRCKKWSCPYCARMLARRWAIRVYKELERRENITYNGETCKAVFVTFTVDGRIKSASAGYSILAKLWDKFRKQMQRRYTDWAYVAFVEGQEKTRGGMPHFHIISNRPLPIVASKRGYVSKHKIHDYAKALGFGHQADVKAVTTKGAAYYVSKYASKASPSAPKNFRRVRSSKGWYKIDKPKREKYFVPNVNESLIQFIDRVHDETGIDHNTLSDRWLKAVVDMRKENERIDGLIDT